MRSFPTRHFNPHFEQGGFSHTALLQNTCLWNSARTGDRYGMFASTTLPQVFWVFFMCMKVQFENVKRPRLLPAYAYD